MTNTARTSSLRQRAINSDVGRDLERGCSLVAAVASLLPRTVLTYVHIDVESACLSLVTRDLRGDVVHTTPSTYLSEVADDAGNLNVALQLAAALGYRNLVCTGEPPKTRDLIARISRPAASAFNIVALSGEDVRRAVKVLQRSRAQEPGVWMRSTQSSTTLNMTIDRRYAFDVTHVCEPVFDLTNEALASSLQNRKVVIVVDSIVDSLYGQTLRQYALERLECLGVKVFHSSEHSKTLESLADIVGFAVEAKLPRNGVFVAVGGGVTLDLVGAAAAMYRRGTDFFRIPTTLIGAIDVCVGIKQAVNFGAAKNLLGAFHVPLGGINDPRFFASLPSSEISAGLAEIIKVGLLLDPRLVDLLERHGAELSRTGFQSPQSTAFEIMMHAELAMMRELHPNLWERNPRRLVDFGHTFSSWLEPASEYQLSHGHAVALDMLLSTALAVDANLCSHELLGRLVDLYRAVQLPLDHYLMRADLLVNAVEPIRLHREGALNLVVPVELGLGTYVQDVDPEQLERALSLARVASACRR